MTQEYRKFDLASPWETFPAYRDRSNIEEIPTTSATDQKQLPDKK